MYDTDALARRGQALENEFFHRVDKKLRRKMRASIRRENKREQLAKITGFQDEELLDHLVDEEFNPETIASLALVPIVFVAWADGSVTAAERQAVIHELLKRGMDQHSEARHLVEHWLDQKPSRSLWRLWTEYVVVLRQTFSPTILEMLANSLLEKATRVAEASREGLTLNNISVAEQAVLDEIQQAFQDRKIGENIIRIDRRA